MTAVHTIGAMLTGQALAMSYEHAQGDLMRAMPAEGAGQAMAVSAGPVSIPAGERFAVVGGVAVMPVRGILTPNSEGLARWLGWSTYQGIEAACGELAADENVKAVAVPVDSVGGMVLGLKDAAQALAALAAVKPVHALVCPLAASAAYHLAAMAGKITVTIGSEVGSIGTMRASSWPVQPDNWGEQHGIHVSSHARSKYPNPTNETGLSEIQRSLDEAESDFLDAVAQGRGLDRAGLPALLSATDDPADGGRMFRAQEAVEIGLADDIKTQSAFFADLMAEHAAAPAAGRSRAMSNAARVRVAKAKLSF